MKHLNIAIAGAGFAGLAAATLLARSGHQVTLWERFETPQAVGAGILIQPTGLAAMRALGIEEQMLAQGAKVDWLHGLNQNQRCVLDIHYRDWRAGAHGLGLHRGVLFEALWAAAAHAGVQVITGQHLTDLSALQGTDLRVVADGAASALRAQTGLAFQDKLYPWGAVWAVLPCNNGQLWSGQGRQLAQWYRAAGQMLGVMPTGMAPGIAPGMAPSSAGHHEPVVSLFWSLPASDFAAFQRAGLAGWQAQVRALSPGAHALHALVEGVQHLEQLTFARYHDVWMPSYHTTNTVVIGDAAHATSPQLGQGTNLALMDAVALAQAVQTASSVAQALAQYTAVRRQHLHFYGQASRFLTPWFQGNGTALPWLRDHFLRLGSRMPFGHGLNLQTLVGVRRGWLGGQLGDV